MTREERERLYAETGDWMYKHDFDDEVCPCGYKKEWREMSEWVQVGAVLAYKGAVYRVLAKGGSNRGKWYPHSVGFVLVQKLDDVPWKLPEAPCLVSEFGASLTKLFQADRIDHFEIQNALHLVP